MHDAVVLLEDMPTQHFETGQPLRLRRGQVGTVVMVYNSSVFEVEFSDRSGRAYAILPIAAEKLLRLYDAPESAVA